MSGTKVTQEERVLLAIYKKKEGCSAELLKKELGMSDKSYTHTLHLLEKGNFIKTDGDLIRMTPHGEYLCRLHQS